MRRPAAGTIVAKQHLPVARVLADSFLDQHPDVPFYVLLTDEVDGYFQPAAERFRFLQLGDLAIPGFTAFKFSYSPAELSYAATPFLLEYLLDRGHGDVAFIKQESLVLGDLIPVFEGGRHSLILTPHLLEPLPGDDRFARELNILQAGSFNAGFVGVSESLPAREFLKWWQARTLRHCRLDVAAGMHYEQRWLDLAPSFFTGVHILRDPGMNVAHWNLPERQVTIGPDGAVLASGRPCRLFRFSGFDFEQPHFATRYNTRLTLDNLGPAAAVYRRYHESLAAAGCHETKSWPFAYDCFDNGVTIPYIARQIYRDLGGGEDRFGDPYRTGSPSSFFAWINGSGEWSGGEVAGAITRLWEEVYHRRPDLQLAYPDFQGADRQEFISWIRLYGYQDCGIDESFPAVVSKIREVR